jgi:hypothetical protein
MTEEKAIEMIIAELRRAEIIHPFWPTDIIHQAATLGEEAGEVLQEANNYVYEGGSKDQVVKECIHTGAMAIRMLVNL